MRKNTIIWKVANASLAFFISTSYVVSASETVELEGENQLSMSLSHHHSYEKILQDIKELTDRIHREVDKVLADYKRDTAEYHRRMGTMRGTIKTTEQDREKDFVLEKLKEAEGGKPVEIIPWEKGGAESPKIQIPDISMNQKEINELSNKEKQEILRQIHNFERDYSDTYDTRENSLKNYPEYQEYDIGQQLGLLVNGIVYSNINIPKK
jgi:hypothetical protein